MKKLALINMIKINNVNHFFKEKQILKDFSLNINSNSVTSILGPSGSGKTTLLRLISGLENTIILMIIFVIIIFIQLLKVMLIT